MSKFLYINYRNVEAEKLNPRLKEKVRSLFEVKPEDVVHLNKDDRHLFVVKQRPNVKVDENLDFKIAYPSVKDDALYISIKHDTNNIYVSGDKVGSRVIWYYTDKEKFILSSSQRAIIAVLGSFQLNECAWIWMLSNGSIGPGNSWDKRILALPADARLCFDKAKWSFEVSVNNWSFNYNETSERALKENLETKFKEVKSDFRLGTARTLLTLSGGCDSRAALYLLKENRNIHTATWGIPSAFKTPNTDATIARMVSAEWKLPHKEYNVQSNGKFEENIDAFLKHGEGRNDHINSFMDGLEMWQNIEAEKFEYVIRADEAFGWLPVKTELDVRTSVAYAHLSDFKNIPQNVAESLPKQNFPAYLNRKENEPIRDYRDRLYQQYRLPFVIGPLQDPPLSFVEILNPLLHPKLIDFARGLPPHLRTGKRLYAEWVNTLLPDIPYATVPAIPEAYNIASSKENKDVFEMFVNDTAFKNFFGSTFANFVKGNLEVKANASANINSRLKVGVYNLLPVPVKKFLRNSVMGYKMKKSSLLLRAYIIYKMDKLMHETAKG